MRIAVVSDTHGHVPYTQAAVRTLQRLQVELVLHCGDIGSPAIVPLFADWPTHFVLGNVDDEHGPLRSAIDAAGQSYHDRFGTLELEQVKIVFLHGDDEPRFRQTISSGNWNLVCYGHTHLPEQHFAGPTLVLNPGALFRATPHTLATVELPALTAVHVPVPNE